MSARHHGRLYVAARSPVHDLAPEAKLAGLFAFVVCVALTPRHAVGAFAVDAAVLAVIFLVARLPPSVLLRLFTIVPFVAFALAVPFIAGGDQVDVFGIGLSVDGLWAAWNIVIKAALGALASIVLAATTPLPDVLAGLGRLRAPSVVVSIIAFMFRYLDLLVDQLWRMRLAMTARCHDPRWLWQAGAVASSVGVLFVRSYERGERIHHAMLSRGFTGTMPELDDARATARDWLVAAIPATLGVVALAVAVSTG